MTSGVAQRLAAWACVGVAVFYAHTSEAQSPCRNFQPGELSTATIRTEFSGAVLQLKTAGKPSGTGFLIDSTRGYVLTASHVVKSGSGKVITGESPEIPGRVFSLQIAKSHPNKDLVLLKLSSPEELSRVRAIDISFQFPNEDTPLFAMGYPAFGDQPATTLHTQNVKVIATPDSMLQLSQAGAEGGASGGPLLTAAGAAVATAMQSVGVGGSVARYVPMYWAAELIDEIPMSQAMLALDADVRASRIGADALVAKMTQKSGNPSNVELYAWARRIQKNQDQYKPVAQLIRCPVMQALSDRGLGLLVIENTPFADVTHLAAAFLSVAAQELGLARYSASALYAESAEQIFSKLKDVQGQSSARVILANAMVELGLVTEARQELAKIQSSGATLSLRERAVTYALAGRIEEQSGNLAVALPNYAFAYETFFGAGNYWQAANLSAKKAEVNMLVGKYSLAQMDWNQAYKLYAIADNAAGQSESLFRLAIAKKASGEKEGYLSTLKQYGYFFPAGKYAVEAARVVAQEERPLWK